MADAESFRVDHSDTKIDRRWVILSDDKDAVRSAIGVPLTTSTRLVGILILAHPT